ncbi:MAG TPA: Rieske (2Fe-2S) protein [Longimicrobium sp.]|nr:Rieske (2Fe-2S) protein [Longimicrobium sp.]
MGETIPGACQACLSRRAFVGQSTLLAVSALLAGCGDGQIGPVGPAAGGTQGGSTTVRLADYPALQTVGGMVRVNTGSGPVAVVRATQATFAAFSMVCPHQGATLNLRAAGFSCPSHGATFNAGGVWTGGQRTGNLASVTVTYDAAAGLLTLGAAPGTGGGGGGDDDDD